MPTVKDLVEESSLEEGSEGYTCTRAFMVSGLTGDADRKLFSALEADGIPRRGDFHPSIPNLVAVGRSTDAIDVGTIKVRVTYKPYNASTVINEVAPPKVSMGATVQDLETYKDHTGATMYVYYTSTPVNGASVYDKTKDSGKATGKVNRSYPMPVARLTRRERKNPLDLALQYVGRVNLLAFRGGAARTWLITRIEGDSEDGGESFTNTYELAYNPSTWDATVIFADKETGEIPNAPEPSEGNGIATFQIYPAVDFDPLNLGALS
ncbi:MAG: hypothetical protein AMXMBFR7_26840 [Planctomycetota bacterium]